MTDASGYGFYSVELQTVGATEITADIHANAIFLTLGMELGVLTSDQVLERGWGLTRYKVTISTARDTTPITHEEIIDANAGVSCGESVRGPTAHRPSCRVKIPLSGPYIPHHGEYILLHLEPTQQYNVMPMSGRLTYWV